MNYKVLVDDKNNAQVQQCFFDMGYSWNGKTEIMPLSHPINGKYWIGTAKDGLWWATGHCAGKLVTLPELENIAVQRLNPLDFELNLIEEIIDQLQPTYSRITADNDNLFFSINEEGVSLELVVKNKDTGATRKSSYSLRQCKLLRDKYLKDAFSFVVTDWFSDCVTCGHDRAKIKTKAPVNLFFEGDAVTCCQCGQEGEVVEQGEDTDIVWYNDFSIFKSLSS